MKIITTNDNLIALPELWKRTTFLGSHGWAKTMRNGKTAEEIYNLLISKPLLTKDDVNDIFGDTEYINIRCGECQKVVDIAVAISSYVGDYDLHTTVCFDCIAKMAALKPS